MFSVICYLQDFHMAYPRMRKLGAKDQSAGESPYVNLSCKTLI